ncbi:MAG: DUF2157 domain-containing protein [Acidobacteria bacterium]|nr:DUF2157 domain-containing protein [Acidobacteriota bacterium]
MRSTDYLARWREAGAISAPQHDAIAALVTRRRLSVFAEINALLYLGVLASVAGVAATVRTYSTRWGMLVVLVPLTAMVVGCVAYATARSPDYSHERIESTNPLVDYAVYLACLLFGVELAYLTQQFPALRGRADDLLLASSALYFVAAYRFDNRFVLSLAIAALGGWFGVRLASLGVFDDLSHARNAALGFAGTIAVLGALLTRLGVKRHFVDAYLHVAVNVALATVTWGVLDSTASRLWVVAAVVGAGVTIAGGVRRRRFAFVVYGTVYGYIAVSGLVLRNLNDFEASLAFLVVSAVSVVVGLVALARKVGRQP